MAFTLVYHGCEVLYEGRDIIPLCRLKAKHDGKCARRMRKKTRKQPTKHHNRSNRRICPGGQH